MPLPPLPLGSVSSNQNTSSACSASSILQTMQRLKTSRQDFSLLGGRFHDKCLLLHPDHGKDLDAALAASGITKQKFQTASETHRPSSLSYGIPIFYDDLVPKTAPKKDHYELPNGTVVPASEVRVEEQFVTWGPEDLDLLLFIGVIKQAETACVFLMDINWNKELLAGIINSKTHDMVRAWIL